MRTKQLNTLLTKQLSKEKRIGVIKAKDWWEGVEMRPVTIVLPEDFVVGRWVEYENPSDKDMPYREEFETISICRKLIHALVIVEAEMKEKKELLDAGFECKADADTSTSLD